jgi:hypothetical protein
MIHYITAESFNALQSSTLTCVLQTAAEGQLEFHCALETGSRGSSVDILSYYRLDGRGLIPDSGKGFFL